MLSRLLVLSIILLFLSGCSQDLDKTTVDNAAKQPEIVTENVQYTAGGAELAGYFAYDKNQSGKRPGVIVVHEWWGQSEYIRERARQLAELGYTAFAIDMYGDGKYADHPEDAQKFMMEAMSNIPVAEERFKAALELLRQHKMVNSDQTAAIGYCFGGAVVLHMARIGTDLDGVVSFHGNLGSMHKPEPGDIKARILVCHGAADPFVPQEQIDAFKAEMEAADANYTFEAYDGAVHAFTNPGATAIGEKFELPLSYNEAADKKSWNAMKKVFQEIF